MTRRMRRWAFLSLIVCLATWGLAGARDVGWHDTRTPETAYVAESSVDPATGFVTFITVPCDTRTADGRGLAAATMRSHCTRALDRKLR